MGDLSASYSTGIKGKEAGDGIDRPAETPIEISPDAKGDGWHLEQP